MLYGMMPLGICLAVVSAVSSCGKDTDPGYESGSDVRMMFDISVPETRTKVSGNSFENGDKVGLYVTDYVGDTTPMPLQISGNRANNIGLSFNGMAWTSDRTVYWGDGKSDVYAYYPYMDKISDVNSQYVSVASDQTSDGYEASDFLWAKTEGVSRSGGAVSLGLKHIMSKLTVRIVAGNSYVGSLPEDASVLLHSTVSGARIDLEKGAVVKDQYSGAKSIMMKKLGLKTVDGKDAVVYEAIVVPQMIETSVPLIEINSKSVSYLLEDSFNFRPGVSYVYTATLNTSTTAIKVDIGCEIDDWNSTGSGSGSGSGAGGENPGIGDDDGTVYADLSAAGTANCYLISEVGNYKFKAVQGNTDGTVGNVKSVDVLWESFGTDVAPNVGDLIASASYKDGYIRFGTPETFSDGNAVIAAKNSKGTILWSWHIWCAKEGFKEQVYYNDAGTMMDRNLGATSATPGDAGCLGLMYQWGRKDPFLGSSSISSSKQTASTGTWAISSSSISHTMAEENPMTFYTGSSNCLPNGSWDSKKTAYDPCPAGWRVPAGGEDGVWAKASGSKDSFAMSFVSGKYGYNFSGKLGDDSMIWYPASGYLDNGSGSLDNVGDYGYYWSSTPNPSYSNNAWYLSFSSNVCPAGSGSRSYGGSVRCLQE